MESLLVYWPSALPNPESLVSLLTALVPDASCPSGLAPFMFITFLMYLEGRPPGWVLSVPLGLLVPLAYLGWY